jgi:uncharacterized protein YkwD
LLYVKKWSWAFLTLMLVSLTGCAVALPGQAAPSPAVSPAPSSPDFPAGPVYTPSALPFKPAGALADIFQFTLDLINRDRTANGLGAVALGSNGAAQKHAQDMFDNYFLSHWGTDGLKPYMRYTLEGGLNYDAENSAYGGPLQKLSDPGSSYARIDPRTEIKALEDGMLNQDAASNWGHRDNILNPLHTKVNLGIAYDTYHLTLVQDFESEYLEWTQPPTLTGNTFSAAGRITRSGTELKNVNICFDSTPQPSSPDQLNQGAHSYSLGRTLNFLVAPPPPGMFYSQIDPSAIQASAWQVDPVSGRFYIQADISRALASGSGVYTFVLVANLEGQPRALTNFSLFVK